MGNCSDKGQSKIEKSTESVDPPVAAVQEDSAPVAAREESKVEPEPPHPAPITVDLHNPAVDLSAPLDERDIDLVQQTFARVAMLGAENVGWVVFMNIFELAPQARGLFPFKDDLDLANSSRMKAHAGRVVTTLATAVSLLRDLPTLVPVLHSLGLKHIGYGVIPAHYDVVGQAIIKALTTALGPKMTPAVTNAYLKVYTIVKNTMIEKCDYKHLEAPAATDAAPKAPSAEAEAGGADKKHGATEEAKAKKTTNQAAAAKKKKEAATKKTSAEDEKKPEEAEKKPTEQAKVEEKKAEGPTPDEQLLAAAAKGDDKAIAKLLKSGANVNAVDAEGKTALMFACEQGLEDMVGRLSSVKKVKVNMQTNASKETALHFACLNEHKDCAVMVVRSGGDVKKKNKAGKACYDLTKDSQLKQWLQGNNPGGTPPPWQGQKMR